MTIFAQHRSWISECFTGEESPPTLFLPVEKAQCVVVVRAVLVGWLSELPCRRGGSFVVGMFAAIIRSLSELVLEYSEYRNEGTTLTRSRQRRHCINLVLPYRQAQQLVWRFCFPFLPVLLWSPPPVQSFGSTTNLVEHDCGV